MLYMGVYIKIYTVYTNTHANNCSFSINYCFPAYNMHMSRCPPVTRKRANQNNQRKQKQIQICLNQNETFYHALSIVHSHKHRYIQKHFVSVKQCNDYRIIVSVFVVVDLDCWFKILNRFHKRILWSLLLFVSLSLLVSFFFYLCTLLDLSWVVCH